MLAQMKVLQNIKCAKLSELNVLFRYGLIIFNFLYIFSRVMHKSIFPDTLSFVFLNHYNKESLHSTFQDYHLKYQKHHNTHVGHVNFEEIVLSK